MIYDTAFFFWCSNSTGSNPSQLWRAPGPAVINENSSHKYNMSITLPRASNSLRKENKTALSFIFLLPASLLGRLLLHPTYQSAFFHSYIVIGGW
jgi:hypothetical protein